jgi:hypothetical protein
VTGMSHPGPPATLDDTFQPGPNILSVIRIHKFSPPPPWGSDVSVYSTSVELESLRICDEKDEKDAYTNGGNRTMFSNLRLKINEEYHLLFSELKH